MDEAEKAATTAGEPQFLPLSLAAVKQQINALCAASVKDMPPEPVLRWLRGAYHPSLTRKALYELPRHAATAVAQLRAGHTPLAAFLHRINAADSPNCQECSQPETTEHFLLLCRSFKPQRIQLVDRLCTLQLKCSTQTLLTDPRAYKPLAKYVAATKRFLKARQWRPPPSQGRSQDLPHAASPSPPPMHRHSPPPLLTEPPNPFEPPPPPPRPL